MNIKQMGWKLAMAGSVFGMFLVILFLGWNILMLVEWRFIPLEFNEPTRALLVAFGLVSVFIGQDYKHKN